MRPALRHLTRNAVAYLALFVALAGTSYAAVELRKGQVKKRHLGKNAVTSVKVKNRSLKAVDFRRGVLRRGATGAQGAQGAPGPAGPAGPTASAFGELESASVSLASGDPVPVVSATLTTRVPSTILASGGVHVVGGGSPSDVYCFTYVAGDAAPPSRMTVQTVWDATLPVGGARALPAGTHTVEVRCRASASGTTADDAWVNAVAVATG